MKGGTELGNFFSVFDADVGEVNGMIIPNWSVFKTLRWLRDNTSDDTEEWGDSYYFYQTCMDGFKFPQCRIYEEPLNISRCSDFQATIL